MSKAITDLLNILDLEKIEENLFRGRSPQVGWQRVFGGLVIAQALVAAQRTVEHAAAHPSVIGTHWFQWIDQPSTGRNDGENYNIGLIDVTDQPYADVVNLMAQTHKRLFDVHSGRIPPTDKMPEGRSTAEILLKETTMIPPP